MNLEPPTHGERETVYDRLAALLAVVLTAIHVYLGVTTGSEQFLVVGGLFLLWLGLYFTAYWRAVIYLLAAVYVATLGVLWVLSGMQYAAVGAVTGVVSLAFIGLVVYLFFRESEMFT